MFIDGCTYAFFELDYVFDDHPWICYSFVLYLQDSSPEIDLNYVYLRLCFN
jgi:hypothetical protein